MRISRRAASFGGLGLLAGASLGSAARADWGENLLAPVESLDDFWLATDAYIYGYPLVTMEMTRRVITNVAAPEGSHAPMGQLARLRQYPDASFRDVTAPNADTLYTSAFIDVGDEPWLVSSPDMAGRYFLLPMLDGWTTVFQAPGSRTTGTGAQTFAITGPKWSGALPQGVIEYKSPTSLVWLLGRIYCTGTPEDYAAVHALQDKIKLYPLSAYGKDYSPPPAKADPAIDMRAAVRDKVNGLSAREYFTLLAELMKRNPPAAADEPVLGRFARIGLVPGASFDPSKLDDRLDVHIPALAFDRIMLHFKLSGGDVKNVNGWAYTTRTGLYGTDYIQRALVAAIGLGANRPQDAVYPTSPKGADGRDYDGAEKYVVRFPKGQLPPAKGFWSITMYDENYFFVANAINRYSISMRADPKLNADGSLDILIQSESPGKGKEANRLPAPKGKFILMMRLYWPDARDPSILDGSWRTPPVIKLG